MLPACCKSYDCTDAAVARVSQPHIECISIRRLPPVGNPCVTDEIGEPLDEPDAASVSWSMRVIVSASSTDLFSAALTMIQAN